VAASAAVASAVETEVRVAEMVAGTEAVKGEAVAARRAAVDV